MPENSGGEPLPPGRAASGVATSPDAPFVDAPFVDALFPDALPLLPWVRLSACRGPAAGRGPAPGRGTEGDWLDALVLPGGMTALVLAHVDGPGRQARAAAVRLRDGLREVLRGGAPPAGALAGLAAAAARSPLVRRATACVAVLNPVTGDVRYAATGQPGPVISTAPGANGRRAGAVRELPVPGARPLEAGTAVLPPGAVLLLYSGPASRAAENGPPVTARRVADSASTVLADGDITAADLADRVGPAVLAGLTGAGSAGTACVLATHRLQAPVAGWSMDLPADPLALRSLRGRLRDWLHELGASLADRTDVELAVWEAAVNAIVHGRPAAGAATITVRAALDDAGRAVIEVSDRGRWRPPGPPQPGRRWPGGQGLLVIRQAADELDIAPGPDGTTVTVRRSLSRPVPGEAQPGEYRRTAERPGTPA